MIEKFLLCTLAVLALVGWSVVGTVITRTTPETVFARYTVFATLFVSVVFTFASLAYYLGVRVSGLNRPEGMLRLS
ncbi:MAG: hypothetical protein Q7O66_05295, partial [Dehalococcoidia bacterium]|nr:hypothetical protein [Dehalococcoidia bacterium]